MVGLNLNFMERLDLMKTEPYGTVRYYANLFGDIIADAQADNQATSDNIIEAFKLSLKEWREYYEKGAEEIKRMQAKINDEI